MTARSRSKAYWLALSSTSAARRARSRAWSTSPSPYGSSRDSASRATVRPRAVSGRQRLLSPIAARSCSYWAVSRAAAASGALATPGSTCGVPVRSACPAGVLADRSTRKRAKNSVSAARSTSRLVCSAPRTASSSWSTRCTIARSAMRGTSRSTRAWAMPCGSKLSAKTADASDRTPSRRAARSAS
ncbi:MAG: hypothetical protein AVDCRST_MAG16-3020 [uncultured Frankineae bacterium]|uniref:Uncharacterized protein n=1 Tax=uncultured Frankineae bacterium TaxID=437475 RepID=A0A6J4MPK3_9ACTN|nr:MAG: hypothetical protein AVDCRST_MAG16-3020 [uncultured Frankineae bacterium]